MWLSTISSTRYAGVCIGELGRRTRLQAAFGEFVGGPAGATGHALAPAHDAAGLGAGVHHGGARAVTVGAAHLGAPAAPPPGLHGRADIRDRERGAAPLTPTIIGHRLGAGAVGATGVLGHRLVETARGRIHALPPAGVSGRHVASDRRANSDATTPGDPVLWGPAIRHGPFHGESLGRVHSSDPTRDCAPPTQETRSLILRSASAQSSIVSNATDSDAGITSGRQCSP